MIIIKFALISFLVAMTLMIAMHPGQGAPVGGPFFYQDKPGSLNPIRPGGRVNPYPAKKRHRGWRVWFDGSGDPVKWRLYKDGVPVYAEELIWNKPGRLIARRQIPV